MTQTYPPQGWQGAPNGAPWQHAGPPQDPPAGPPQQMEAPMPQGDAAGFFSSSKSFLFNVAKDPSVMRRWRGGQIISPPRQEQCRVYQQDGSTGPLAFWDDEKTRRKWQLIVTVASSEHDPADPSDSGHRSLYIKEGTDLFRKLKALPTSVRMMSGDWLWVNYYADDPTSKGSIPAKLFDVVHAIRPGEYGYGQPPTHTPGGGQQPAATQPPQQPAPWVQQPSGPPATPANPWGSQPVQQPAWQQAPAAQGAPAGPPQNGAPWQQGPQPTHGGPPWQQGSGQPPTSLSQVPWPPPDTPAQPGSPVGQQPPWVQQAPPWATQQG